MTDEPTDDLWLDFLATHTEPPTMAAIDIDGGKSRDLSIFLPENFPDAAVRALVAEARLAQLADAAESFIAAVSAGDPRCVHSALNQMLCFPRPGCSWPDQDANQAAESVVRAMFGGGGA